jgi:NPCBM/NEW2 domain
MRAMWCGCCLTLSLVCHLSRPIQAEEIVTVDGEKTATTGVTIIDRQISLPPTGGIPAKVIPLEDLVEFSRTIHLDREMGELKTRFVRVEHLSAVPQYLSLAEVVVYEGDKNIAPQGRATQVGTAFDGPPEKAIDGNADGNLNTGKSVTCSTLVPHPWWEVDLQRDVKVRQVEIWNRTDDNVGPRLFGSRVVLLDANRKPLWVHHLDKPGKQTILKIPPTGAQFSKADLEQFQRYGGITSTSAQSMNESEVEFKLVGGARFYGKITEWTKGAIKTEIRFGDQLRTLTVPTSWIHETWPQGVVTGKIVVSQTGEQPDFDNIYAKSDSGEFQRIAGKVLGQDGDSYQIEIEGQTRQLSRTKVFGIVFQQQPPTNTDSQYEIADFLSGQHIPGHVTQLTADTFQMETMWAEKLELPRSQLDRIRVKHGQLVSLTEVTPRQVEQVGYLDLVRPYQVNKSFSGSPLQIGNVKFAEGFCTHSQTVMDYDLGAGFRQFRCQVGLQKDDGDLGHVIVRVRVDGVDKFEEALAGGQSAKAVSIDLTGAKLLQLEVDFGDGFDVADHLVWGAPVLLKAKK